MGRRRKHNPLDLPDRVYAKHGAFYYFHRPTEDHPSGRWERLGTDVGQAKDRANRIQQQMDEGFGTVAYWLDQFLIWCRKRVAVGDLAQRTLDDYTTDAEVLKIFFGSLYPAAVAPSHVGEFLDTNLEGGRGVRANREKACLSSMFTWLIRKGHAGVTTNPCRGVRRNPEKKRERYVEDVEMAQALKNAPLMVWALAHLVYRTLQRPEDIITWTERDIVRRRLPDGREVRVIRNNQAKTGAMVDIEVTGEIDEILINLKAGAGKLRGMTLLHRRDGKPYTYDGLCAMLKRRQAAAKVASFGFYDLKGKGATDMWQSGVPLEVIQVLCGHDSVTTTERYVKQRWRGVVQPNKVKAAV
ncbi:tyrosine-type recombinase/integrase [Aquamicrobium sp.]|uniref:site-specific integrase n=1 Tax=Aquamicrobium sp. TaxID=1872579 RepID=UPI002584043D|nr:tyrosine-type recombinase/integrase [Aquamicrobium sp.]MCK9550259.1 tyrosine-type recombinase/integrase [Aquamicrobium sp.]